MPEDDPVEILQDGPQWVVRIIEDGAPVERRFDFQRHAEAWADGQRHRLNFKKQKLADAPAPPETNAAPDTSSS